MRELFPPAQRFLEAAQRRELAVTFLLLAHTSPVSLLASLFCGFHKPYLFGNLFFQVSCSKGADEGEWNAK